MSMLIHTSPLIAQHDGMDEVISGWLDTHRADLGNGTGAISAKLIKTFNDETTAVPLEGDTTSLTVGGLMPHLQQALIALEIAIENGVSDKRLDFTKGPKTYVVIGGTVLARGLTIEGLSVSFFLRPSVQYDTLLQMGRWFGYRGGYEDLPRLWTTDELISSFRALARIEEEIRDDIGIYREDKSTPAEFAVKVRAIPGMAITSASKMRHAFRTSISFEGRHVQTIRFDHQSERVVSTNWAAAEQLVDDIGAHNINDQGKRKLARGVQLGVIRKFLKTYEICDQHMDLKRAMLLAYIDKVEQQLPEWNVGFITPGSNLSRKALGALGKVPTNCRAKLTASEKSYADIKALMSKNDILIDAVKPANEDDSDSWSSFKQRRPDLPLLLLYAIDRESPSKAGSENRVALDATDDLIGIGIVFPGARDRAGSYYAVELDVAVAETVDEEIEELIATEEAETTDA